jgi:hypothetical protein
VNAGGAGEKGVEMAKATGKNGQLPKMTREQAAIVVEYLGESLLNLLTGDDPEKPWSHNAANLPDQGRSSGDESNPSAASRGPADGDTMGLNLPGMKALRAGLLQKKASGDIDLREDLSRLLLKLAYANPLTTAPVVGRERR